MAASSNSIVSKGFTISLSSFTGKLMDIDGPGLTREALDITHQATATYKEKTPSPFVDGEPINIKFQSNDSDNFTTLITASTAAFVLTYPVAIGRTTAASWSVSAFLTSIKQTGALGQVITGDATITPTGTPTFTAGG